MVATADNDGWGWVPQNVLDNNPSTGWHTSTDAPHWRGQLILKLASKWCLQR